MISRRCKAHATYLVGKPASTMTTIADDLDLRSAERHQLHYFVLTQHSNSSVAGGWAVDTPKARPFHLRITEIPVHGRQLWQLRPDRGNERVSR